VLIVILKRVTLIRSNYSIVFIILEFCGNLLLRYLPLPLVCIVHVIRFRDGASSHKTAMCQSCVRYVSAMCQSCVGHVSAMCQSCVSHVSGMCQSCVGRVSGMCLACVWYVLVVFHKFTCPTHD